jgi:hypothetical protein
MKLFPGLLGSSGDYFVSFALPKIGCTQEKKKAETFGSFRKTSYLCSRNKIQR